jgi:hypothetical protein
MENTLFGKIKLAFILWLARRLPDCKVIVKTLGETLDRRLSLKEKILAKLHLFTCEACERYLKQVKFLHDAAHAHEARQRNEFSSLGLGDKAKERLKETLRTAGGWAF